MSILIKGMEMPETCGKCKMHFIGDDYVCCSITERVPKIVSKFANSKTDLNFRKASIDAVKRPDWCPLVEVPTPPAERKGRWIVLDECTNEGVYCSECHKKVFKIDYSNTMKWKNFNFCPNCGADMRGEEDD